MENTLKKSQYINYYEQREKPKRTKTLFITCMVIFSLLFLIRDVFSFDIPLPIFLIAAGIMYMVFDVNESVAFTVSLLIFGCGMQVNYALGMGLIAIFIKKYNTFRFTGLFLLFGLLMLYEFAHFVINPFSLTDFLRTAICYMMLAIIVADKNANYDTKLILRTFILVCLFVCTDILLQTIVYSGFNLLSWIEEGFRFGFLSNSNGGATLSNNQNVIAQYCVVSTACVLFLMYYSKKIRIGNYFLLVAAFIFGLLTVSRTFMIVEVLALVIGVFLILKQRTKDSKKIVKMVLGILFSITIMLALLYITMPDLIMNLIERFGAEDLSGGRIDIFNQYNELLLSDNNFLLFGIGLQDIIGKLETIFPIELISSPHNAIQEMIVCWGIIGSVLFTTILVLIIKKAKKGLKKLPLINYLVFIVLILTLQTIQFVRMNENIFMLVLVFCCIGYNEKNELSHK